MSPQHGIFHRWRVALFGERAQRLRESGGQSHWLSYLLVIVQSTAVVLALGHQTIGLLFSGQPAIVAIAVMSLLLLVATVWAADLCLLATLRRLPALARNRQTWSLAEHVAYLAFVLAVEGATLAIVLVVLDTDPLSLVSDRPIIPAVGWLFALLIGARVALVAWTSVQLWIVRQKLPPQWATLILEARELIGGKAQGAMAGLHMEHASIAQLFAAYAAMSRPPARMARWFNRGIIRRELAALAEEDRQRDAVVAALSAFDSRAGAPITRAASPDAPTRPPTGPGTPVLAPAGAPANEGGSDSPPKRQRAAVIRLADPDARPRRRTAAQGRANGRSKGVRTPPLRTPDTWEAEARVAWVDGARSVAKMRAATGMSQSAASGWVRTLKAEDGATPRAAAAQRQEGQAAR